MRPFKADQIAVVARYRENLDWMNLLLCKSIVYNKGPELRHTKQNVVNLHNLGRESQTYLEFIVSNYDDIQPNNTYVFLQGHPFEPHIVNIKEINDVGPVKEFTPFGQYVFREGPRGPVNQQFPMGIPIVEFCDLLFKNSPIRDGSVNIYNLGGQFAVSGKLILSRDINFYKFVNRCLLKKNPIEGHIMERIWHIIFNGETQDRFTAYKTSRGECLKFGAYWGGDIE